MQPATASTPRVNLFVKDQLARLLAQENLTVTHSIDARTASFNPDDRHLVLPVWVNASDDIYDLLVGHEIGHALHSPGKAVTDPVCTEVAPENPGLFFRYLNVAEDIRIESEIKAAFPGMRRSFFNGYKELADKDFFDLKNNPVDQMSLADRINVHAKIGQYGFVNVPFTAEELEIRDAAMSAKSFEDVVAVARRMFEYVPDMQEQEPVLVPSPNGEPAAQSQGKGDSQGQEKQSEPQQQPKNQNGQTDTGNNTSNADTGNNTSTSRPKAPELKTDEAFNKAIDQMRSADSRNDSIEYFKMPRINLDAIVFDWKRVTQDLDLSRAYPGFSGDKIFSIIEDRNKNFVLNLVKQFEQKMAADTIARTSYKRTGELDMRRISNYKFQDDLFQRNIVIQKGKNHGMVMIVDWSGSMANQLMPTVEQMLALTMFCRRMRIPFEVYAFTHSSPIYERDYNDSERQDKFLKTQAAISPDYTVGTGDFGTQINYNGFLEVSKIGMIQFLSSSMSNEQFRHAAENICQLAFDFDSSGAQFAGAGRSGLASGYRSSSCTDPDKFDKDYCTYNRYNLSGTPLNEALYVGIDLVNKFRAAHRLDIVNTIILTDGEPTSGLTNRCYNYNAPKNAILTLPNRKQMPLYDRKSLDRLNANNAEYNGLVSVFKAMTGSTLIRMYITITRMPYWNDAHGYPITDPATLKIIQKTWKEDKFAAVPDKVHDMSFIIKSDIEIVDDPFAGIKEDATVTQITKAFIRNAAKRQTSRVLLSRFSDIIAKQIA